MHVSTVSPGDRPGIRQILVDVAIVAAVVFAASLFGILTRPVGFLASFWPANAVLLGLMVRNPRLSTLEGWSAAFLAYVAADLATGGELHITLWLTAANLAGAMTGYQLFRMLPEDDRRLRRPLSVLLLFGVCASSAVAAAATGGGAARVLFGRDLWTGMEFWFTTELVNSLVILPVILTFPGWPARIAPPWRRADVSTPALARAAPALALLASCAAGAQVGGPGTIAFPVPALIWCALSYGLFAVSVITGLLCAWLLISISLGFVVLPMSPDVISSTTSLRLGVGLMVLGPLTVASINSARNNLLAKLSYAAAHDALTGAVSRGAFMNRGYELVTEMSRSGRPLALLMLDIDHFKRINDRFGHAGGDRVLVEFAGLVNAAMREGDILGRVGGEEFAILLPNSTLNDAVKIAERIRIAVEAASIEVSPHESIRISVSVGVSVAEGMAGIDLERLMATSDGALYEAKSGGRNQVQAAA